MEKNHLLALLDGKISGPGRDFVSHGLSEPTHHHKRKTKKHHHAPQGTTIRTHGETNHTAEKIKHLQKKRK